MTRLVLLTFILFIAFAKGARILAVFPTPSISHQVPFRHLTQELSKRHEVVVITTDPAFEKGKAPTNLTEIDVHDISYEAWKKHVLAITNGRREDFVLQFRKSISALLEIFVMQLQTIEVQKVLRKDTFDLLLLEAWVRPALIFTHFYKVPTIQISSFSGFYTNYEVFGASTHPLIYPLATNHRTYNLTLWEKVKQLYFHYSINKEYLSYEETDNEVLRSNFGRDIPSLSELSNNVDMLFLNVYPPWDGNRPVPPSVLYIGGIHKTVPKELPKDLESYLNSSENAVIYISFGTNLNPSNLPPQKIQMMINVLSQLPYDVLWKWDKDELPGRSENIKIFKWLPQSDLLRHPKIKLFITQCGLQSTDEAITAGVPLLGMPMLGDQWFQAEKYVHFKIGLKLEMVTLTEKEFKDTLEELINNPSYRQNINELRNLMHDQPESALERAVWWTEHVLRHGGARHLRAPAANMSWTEYLELDVILLLFGCFITVVLILGVLIIYVVKYFSSPGFFKAKQS